jgi:type I restriction enzyme S subunit
MEVKPGYKQTEVGVIPEEWEVKPLRSVLSKGRLGGNYANQDTESAFPLMKMGNIARGYFDMSKVEFITPGVTPENQHRLAYGDVLFNTRNTLELVGKVGIWRDELPRAYYNSNLMRLEFDPNEVSSNEYANYALNTAGAVARLRALATGTTSVAAIYTRDLLGLLFVVPPKPEQRAIAEALSDVDGLLGGLDRLIAKKRDLKQAAMQQLLTGHTRLPGFHGEWKLTKLRQFVTADRFAIVDGPFGSQLKVDEYMETGVPVIEMEHLEDGLVTNDLPRFITPKKFNDLKRSAVYPGDILISKTGSLGKLGILPATIECGLITSRLAKISLDPTKADRGFVFQFLLKLRRDGYWEQVSQGGTMQILGIGMLQNAPVPDIAPAEQTAIAEVLTEMDLELAALEQRREKTRALKQAMMQELLTGRIRLV